MKLIIFLSIIFLQINCAGQYPLQKAYQKKDTFYFEKPAVYDKATKTYSMPSFDSVKYFFDKFLYFQKRMDKATGRAFVRFEDSCMKYYKLLYPTKK